jgi:hypothetical protein
MTLAASPQPDILYRVSVLTESCPGYYVDLMYTAPGTPVPTDEVVCERGTQLPARYDVPPPVARGDTITWTLPAQMFPVGTIFSGLQAQTGVDSQATFLPYLDLAFSDATFTVGS